MCITLWCLPLFVARCVFIAAYMARERVAPLHCSAAEYSQLFRSAAVARPSLRVPSAPNPSGPHPVAAATCAPERAEIEAAADGDADGDADGAQPRTRCRALWREVAAACESGWDFSSRSLR